MTLMELIALLRRKIVLIVALPLLFLAAMAAYCYYLLPDQYTATTSMYVLYVQDDGSEGADSAEFSASQMVANDVARLLPSDRIVRETLKKTGLKSLDDYRISVENSTNTRVITLEVTGPDPHDAAAIANAMAREVSKVVNEVMDTDAINVIDSAVAPQSPSGPRRYLYMAVAFLAGLFLAVLIALLADMLNTRVRSADEAAALVGRPVIGRFPRYKPLDRKGR